jgi:hypothetical protein
MGEILGYGEDALTLWALKNRLKVILERFGDKANSSECLIFYRPSFGRRSRNCSSIFGEFDAIVASRSSILLVESKWDNLGSFKEEELALREEQLLRHRIFAWYLTNWNERFRGNWERFVEEKKEQFRFQGKTMPNASSLLSGNLEYVLNRLQQHCRNVDESHIKNVLLYFHRGPRIPSFRVNKTFTPIPIDYTEISGSFIPL